LIGSGEMRSWTFTVLEEAAGQVVEPRCNTMPRSRGASQYSSGSGHDESSD
jgi:hypothetical protein